MSLKNTKRTAQRIIAMVESGNYDPEIIEHMVESVVNNRDKRIKELETRVKPRTFDISLKIISSELINTIKAHGPITRNYVSSAAKRIYGNCQSVVDEPEVVALPSADERLENGNVTIVRDKTATHKLTIARDGNIRIKVAKGARIEEANEIIQKFTTVGIDAIQLNKGTLRGKLKLGEIFKPYCNGISMLTDSKTEKINLQFS